MPAIETNSDAEVTLLVDSEGVFVKTPTFLEEARTFLRRSGKSAEHYLGTDLGTDNDLADFSLLNVYNLDSIPFYASNLTRFKFWNKEGKTDAHILVDFLDNCPLLEHIDISYVDSSRNESDLVVSLPSLRTYTQTTFGKTHSLTVFDKLSFPPSCSVTLGLQIDGETTAADHVLVCFKNPDYLAEIKWVKLGATHSSDGNKVARVLELINAEGTKVRFEGTSFEQKEEGPFVQQDRQHAQNMAYLDSLRALDDLPMETFCIDGYALPGVWGVDVEFFKKALGLGDVRTLILSRNAVEPCLSALDKDQDAGSDGQRFLSIHTLIVHPNPQRDGLGNEALKLLLRVAQMRKAHGSPFISVLLFLRGRPGWDWNGALDGLERCIEKLEVVTGDEALDWNIDKYFLDGLEHLQGNRDIQWD